MLAKGLIFLNWRQRLAKLNVELHCFGLDGDDFLSLHPSAKRWDTIEQILSSIHSQLKTGDAVMLSPACASFDQFSHFMARGDEFTRLAHYFAKA